MKHLNIGKWSEKYILTYVYLDSNLDEFHSHQHNDGVRDNKRLESFSFYPIKRFL